MCLAGVRITASGTLTNQKWRKRCSFPFMFSVSEESGTICVFSLLPTSVIPSIYQNKFTHHTSILFFVFASLGFKPWKAMKTKPHGSPLATCPWNINHRTWKVEPQIETRKSPSRSTEIRHRFHATSIRWRPGTVPKARYVCSFLFKPLLGV